MMETPDAFSPPALEMRRVAFVALRDAGTEVAAEIDWTVNAGEFWLVAGPQRSGKSDFLMLTGGLMPPTRGTYRLFGDTMPVFEEERLPERLRLGFVFDGGQLFRGMTIAENVSLPLRYHRHPARQDVARRTQAVLEAAELTAFAHSRPDHVARNWQKRAALARALALQPQVLLLDNPLSGLDARHTGWWLDFLIRLSRGHVLNESRPMTLVATADDLRPWRGIPVRLACLVQARLRIFRDWPEMEACPDATVREMFSSPPAIDRTEGI